MIPLFGLRRLAKKTGAPGARSIFSFSHSICRFQCEIAEVGSTFGLLHRNRGETRSYAEVGHVWRGFQLWLTHVVIPEYEAALVRVPARGGRRVVQQPVVIGAVM